MTSTASGKYDDAACYKPTVLLAVTIALASVVGRHVGWEISPGGPHFGPSWLTQLVGGINAPAIVSGSLAALPFEGVRGYYYLDLFSFFLSVALLWIAIPVWVERLCAGNTGGQFLFWSSTSISLSLAIFFIIQAVDMYGYGPSSFWELAHLGGVPRALVSAKVISWLLFCAWATFLIAAAFYGALQRYRFRPKEAPPDATPYL